MSLINSTFLKNAIMRSSAVKHNNSNVLLCFCLSATIPEIRLVFLSIGSYLVAEKNFRVMQPEGRG
jgi:hypothetical protein